MSHHDSVYVLVLTMRELRDWCERNIEIVEAFEKVRSRYARRNYRMKWWYNIPADKLICLVMARGANQGSSRDMVVSTAQALFERYKDYSITSIESVWTHPETRRRGYAKLCIKTLLHSAVHHRRVDVCAMTCKLNQIRPINLYKSLGFVKLATVLDTYSVIYQQEITSVTSVEESDRRKRAVIELLTDSISL